jgi:hypothetical protein
MSKHGVIHFSCESLIQVGFYHLRVNVVADELFTLNNVVDEIADKQRQAQTNIAGMDLTSGLVGLRLFPSPGRCEI